MKSLCGLTDVPSNALRSAKHTEYIILNFMIVCSRAKAVKIHGIRYTKNAVIRVRKNEECVYVEIIEIYVINDLNIFYGRQLEIQHYNSHTRSYTIGRTDNMILAT